MIVLNEVFMNPDFAKNTLVVALVKEPAFVAEDSWRQEFYVGERCFFDDYDFSPWPALFFAAYSGKSVESVSSSCSRHPES